MNLESPTCRSFQDASRLGELFAYSVEDISFLLMACPKIRELRVRAVRVPMAEPHKTASGTISESPLVLTDIVTDDGTTGHSMIFTYTVAALKPTADLIKNLEPFVKGELLAPIDLADKFAKRFRLLGLQGLVAMAVSAIDMALWDALARSHHTSLVRLLGSTEKPIAAYGAVGYDGVKGSAEGAEDWAKNGFKGVKAKIGYPTVEEDLEVVRAMRKAVGNEMAIMVDYNQSLTPPEAVRRLRVLDEEGLTWVEEPVLAHDYQGQALVAREIKTPIQCGENWWGSQDMRQAVESRASDYMMPDVMKIGGVTGWMRAAALGEACGIPLSNHLWPEISAQLLCATPTAHFLEYANWWNPVLAQPLQIEQGMAIVEGMTGTGVAWNERAVERFVI
jgi:mandelate racemase